MSPPSPFTRTLVVFSIATATAGLMAVDPVDAIGGSSATPQVAGSQSENAVTVPAQATPKTTTDVPSGEGVPAPEVPFQERYKSLSDVAKKATVEVFTNAWRHGLNPEYYHANVLATEFAKPDDQRLSNIPDLFIEAIGRYAHDMTGMRVRASSIGLRSQDWRQGIDPKLAIAAYFAAPDGADYLTDLAPKTALYTNLQESLVSLRDLIAAGKGGEAIYPLKSLKHLIRPGDENPAIADLRERLGAKVPENGNANKYDDVLAQVVMEFQRNHGLKDDGIIGPQTVQFFNQTHFERYQQVLANLERIRWLDPVKPEKYIVVNIPAATLWAVENDQVVHEMPVIVGRAKRATQQFRTMVQGVRFNPTWTVPDTIKKEDFLPELQKDPSFLATKGVELWKVEGKERVRVDPLYIDWQDVTEEDLATYRFVQPAGRSNALGQIRVLMPNQYGIYLHDTNTPEYFRDDDRSISSGCIRLSRPRDVAQFVLDKNEGWDESRIEKAISDEKTRDITAQPSFPVILLYQTAWMKKEGGLVLSYDIYKEDIKLYKALERAGGLPK